MIFIFDSSKNILFLTKNSFIAIKKCFLIRNNSVFIPDLSTKFTNSLVITLL